ncbi:MAG: cytochrome c3 family protein [Pseudomonadota bacterium]
MQRLRAGIITRVIESLRPQTPFCCETGSIFGSFVHRAKTVLNVGAGYDSGDLDPRASPSKRPRLLATKGPYGRRLAHRLLRVSVILLLAAAWPAGVTADNAPCFECHEDKDLVRETNGEGSVFIDGKIFGASVHTDVDCTDCHQDAELVDDEHKPDLGPVNCAECHEKQAKLFGGSTHGKALAAGDPLAPNCASCHGKHDIFLPQDRRSKTYRLNIPKVCSKCHAEGHVVAKARDLGEDHPVETYSMSIHYRGVFKRGLVGAAVCSDCHGSHDVLPHEDPASRINHENIAKTCTQCHVEIEQVHVKVIKDSLWEEAPGQIPACIDCHSPHKVRKVKYNLSMADDDCLACHGRKDLDLKAADGRSLLVDRTQLHDSAHTKVTCAMCHSNVSRFDDPPCRHTGKVTCATCHAAQEIAHSEGIHGQLEAQGNEKAPGCKTCHGAHGILPRSLATSPTNVRNIPTLCARCHQAGMAAALLRHGETDTIVDSYEDSIHGRGLEESGLLVTAVCTNCHTAHRPLPKIDPKSTVHKDHVASTCAACHAGIYEDFQSSVHSQTVTDTEKTLPVCSDCHSSHQISRVDGANFRTVITDRCGTCHLELTEAYFETYHGKASLLGGSRVAKCSDCHSAHHILPPDNPASTLHRDHIVATCGACHEGSHRRFAGYLTHATHKDPKKWPILYYTFWFMTLLLTGTLIFFTLHTLLWLPRSFKLMLERRRRPHDPNEVYIRRFQPYHRVTHIMVILSFFSLAITGMMLKFSYTGWAQALSRLFGGFEAAGTIHRLGAVVTFLYFCMHLTFLWKNKQRRGLSWFKLIFHSESMFPNFRDIKEFGQTLRWFVGRGPRPDYGRFTYWEKFDYMAVFWGVSVIGLTGLFLWFPEFFTHFMPGWMINVATIIHSDEALLAAGFIFTVHFFNTHFRPERFPMDPVIFTGAITLSEFKEERPREYRQAVESGSLESMVVERPAEGLVRGATIFGMSMLLLGLTLIGLILYAMFIAYR